LQALPVVERTLSKEETEIFEEKTGEGQVGAGDIEQVLAAEFMLGTTLNTDSPIVKQRAPHGIAIYVLNDLSGRFGGEEARGRL
jgi:hypothetical protein